MKLLPLMLEDGLNKEIKLMDDEQVMTRTWLISYIDNCKIGRIGKMFGFKELKGVAVAREFLWAMDNGIYFGYMPTFLFITRKING